MAFDPDKYLAESGFDPDEYLATAVPSAPTLTAAQIEKQKRRGSKSLVLDESKYQPSAIEETLAGWPARLAYGLATPGLAVLEAIPQTREYAQRATENYKEAVRRGQLGLGKSGLQQVTGGAAEIAGQAAPYTMLPMLRGAKGFSQNALQYLGNIGVGAGAGLTAGMLTPTGEVEDFAKEKERQATTGALLGGGVSAVLPPALALGGKAWSTGRGMLAGAEGQAQDYLAEVFGNQKAREEAAKRLDALRANVSGEVPTSGMAAVGEKPMPAFKALEQAARNRTYASQRLAEMDQQNEAARAKVFEWISKPGQRPPAEQGKPLKMSQAEAVRASITRPLYREASKDVVVVDDTLQTILGGAQVQTAADRAGVSLSQAATNAKVAGTAAPKGMQFGKVTPGQDVPEWSMWGPRTPDVVQPSKVSIDALQRVKDEIDKDILGVIGSSDSAGKTKLAQLKIARKQLDDWMRGNSTKYAQAQDTFKELSEVKNQADVADVLLKALQTPSGVERYSTFLNAMRNAAQTVKRADVPRYEEVGQVFSPTQMRLTQGVQKSLEAEGKYAGMKSPEGILPEVQNVFDATEKATPGWLNVAITAFRKLLVRAGGQMDNQTIAIVDNLMTDPRKMAAFMRKATPAERDRVAQYVASYVDIAKKTPAAQAALANEGAE